MRPRSGTQPLRRPVGWALLKGYNLFPALSSSWALSAGKGWGCGWIWCNAATQQYLSDEQSHSHWVFAKTNHSYIDESYLFFRIMECLVARTGTFIIIVIIIIPYICIALVVLLSGFPGGLSGKGSAGNAGTTGAWVQSLSQEDPLEEGMATHSSILAWRILWTVEPGGL